LSALADPDPAGTPDRGPWMPAHNIRNPFTIACLPLLVSAAFGVQEDLSAVGPRSDYESTSSLRPRFQPVGNRRGECPSPSRQSICAPFQHCSGHRFGCPSFPATSEAASDRLLWGRHPLELFARASLDTGARTFGWEQHAGRQTSSSSSSLARVYRQVTRTFHPFGQPVLS